MSNGYLNGFNTIYFNNECFVIDKFSGFRGVEHNVQYNRDLGKWRIEYSAEICFSGNNLKLKRFAHVNYSDDLSWSLFGKSPNKESDFIMNKCSWRDFEKSGFSSGKSNKVMHDYYRWFAENPIEAIFLFHKKIANNYIKISKDKLKIIRKLFK